MVDSSSSPPQAVAWSDPLSDKQYLARRLHPSRLHAGYLALADLAAVVSSCASQVTGRLFDYGCGGTPYREFFPSCVSYTGADIVEGSRVDKLLNADGSTNEPDAAYDTVFSSQVLEHVAHPSRYLREAFRILKPGGRLILTTHGMFPEHGCPHDFHRWTPIGLSREVERAGFTVENSFKITPGARAAVFLLHLAVDDFCCRHRKWLHYAIAIVRRIYRVTLLPALNTLASVVEPRVSVPGDNIVRTYIGVGVVARKNASTFGVDAS